MPAIQTDFGLTNQALFPGGIAVIQNQVWVTATAHHHGDSCLIQKLDLPSLDVVDEESFLLEGRTCTGLSVVNYDTGGLIVLGTELDLHDRTSPPVGMAMYFDINDPDDVGNDQPFTTFDDLPYFFPLDVSMLPSKSTKTTTTDSRVMNVVGYKVNHHKDGVGPFIGPNPLSMYPTVDGTVLKPLPAMASSLYVAQWSLDNSDNDGETNSPENYRAIKEKGELTSIFPAGIYYHKNRPNELIVAGSRRRGAEVFGGEFPTTTMVGYVAKLNLHDESVATSDDQLLATNLIGTAGDDYIISHCSPSRDAAAAGFAQGSYPHDDEWFVVGATTSSFSNPNTAAASEEEGGSLTRRGFLSKIDVVTLQQEWTVEFFVAANDYGNQSAVALKCAVDPVSGQVYVAGMADGSIEQSQRKNRPTNPSDGKDVFVAAVDGNTGSIQWVSQWTGDRVADLAMLFPHDTLSLGNREPASHVLIYGGTHATVVRSSMRSMGELFIIAIDTHTGLWTTSDAIHGHGQEETAVHRRGRKLDLSLGDPDPSPTDPPEPTDPPPTDRPPTDPPEPTDPPPTDPPPTDPPEPTDPPPTDPPEPTDPPPTDPPPTDPPEPTDPPPTDPPPTDPPEPTDPPPTDPPPTDPPEPTDPPPTDPPPTDPPEPTDPPPTDPPPTDPPEPTDPPPTDPPPTDPVTESPTDSPTLLTDSPTSSPTDQVTESPTDSPTPLITDSPTSSPTEAAQSYASTTPDGTAFQSNWGSTYAAAMVYDFTRHSIYFTGATYKFRSSLTLSCFLGHIPLTMMNQWKTVDEPLFVGDTSPDEAIPRDVENLACASLVQDKDVLWVAGMDEADTKARNAPVTSFITSYYRSSHNPDWSMSSAVRAEHFPEQSGVQVPQAMVILPTSNDDEKVVVLAMTNSNDNTLTSDYYRVEEATDHPNLMPGGNFVKRGFHYYTTFQFFKYNTRGSVSGELAQSSQSIQLQTEPITGDLLTTGMTALSSLENTFAFVGSIKGASDPIQPPRGPEGADDFDGFAKVYTYGSGYSDKPGLRFASVDNRNDWVHNVCDSPESDPPSFFVVGSTEGSLAPTNDVDATAPSKTHVKSAFVSSVNAMTMEVEWTTQLYVRSGSGGPGKTGADAFGCHVIPHDPDVMYVAGVVYNGDVMSYTSAGNPTLKSAGDDDIFVAQIDTVDGTIRWVQQFGSSGKESMARNNGIFADMQGDAVIYGDTDGELFRERSHDIKDSKSGRWSNDIFVVKLSQADGSYTTTFENVKTESHHTGMAFIVLVICFCVGYSWYRTHRSFGRSGKQHRDHKKDDDLPTEETEAIFRDDSDARFIDSNREHARNGSETEAIYRDDPDATFIGSNGEHTTNGSMHSSGYRDNPID